MSPKSFHAAPLAAAVALAVLTGPAVAADPATKPEAAQALTVSVVRPKAKVLTETLLVTGSLKPREEIQVGPEIEGYRLTEILAEAGDRVEKGQVLARLSRETLETQLAQNAANAAKARAAIAQEQARLDQTLAQETEASAAVERARQLRKTGTVSQETLDERERAVKVASAQVAATRESLKAAEAEARLVEAQRDELELKLKRTEVKAPEAGIVLSREARIGAIVLSARAEPLFRIARDGAIDLEAEVPEVSMPRIAIGQKVAVTPAGFPDPLEGKVRLVSAEVDRATRLGKAQIAVPSDPRLKPGVFARGLVRLGSHDGLTVPQSAVQFDGAGAYVLVVKDGVVSERRVAVGLKTHGEVEVKDGLGRDDLVVARAGGFLRDGDRVSAQEVPQATSDASAPKAGAR